MQVIGKLLIKKEKESAKLRLGGGSWSINLDVLPDHVEAIQYHTEAGIYSIFKDKAFEHGFIRILGGERKLVVPIKHWSKSNV